MFFEDGRRDVAALPVEVKAATADAGEVARVAQQFR